MGRSGGFIAVAALLTCVASCSSGAPAAAPTSAPPSTTKPATSTTAPPTTAQPKFTPLVSPAKVTAACPFLGATEVPQIIGDGTLRASEAVEGEVTGASGGSMGYNCAYGWGRLWIGTVPAGSVSLAEAIDFKLNDCEQPAVTIAGVGEGAKYCLAKDYQVQVVGGKHSHGQLRIAKVTLTRTRTDVYPSIAKLLVDRL